MKIINLQAENFKRLIAVEITPTGSMVEIAGKNGNGKTSVLDSILVALDGLSSAPALPIHKGALESRITLKLGDDEKTDLVVTRTFRPSKDGTTTTSALKVESADGAKYASPQELLNKLLGKLTFDPLAFDRMSARDQFNALRSFAPGVDFDAIDMANKADYDRRASENRKARELRASAAQMAIPADAPTEIVSVDALVEKMNDAGKHNTDIATRQANRERMADDATARRGRAAAIRREIDALEERIAGLRAEASGFDHQADEIDGKLKAAGPLPAPIDTAELQRQIAAAQETNKIAEGRKRRDAAIEEARKAEEAAAAYTEAMDMREIAKREAVAKAKLPVDGITFGANEVLLNGVPWQQGSDAERLCASLAIAMASNPKLRIIRVRDGSLLDEDSLKLVADMAKDRDYQVWIERVDSSGKVGVVIENGRVKQGDPQPLTSADKPDTI